jgi:hypothetical protein
MNLSRNAARLKAYPVGHLDLRRQRNTLAAKSDLEKQKNPRGDKVSVDAIRKRNNRCFVSSL